MHGPAVCPLTAWSPEVPVCEASPGMDLPWGFIAGLGHVLSLPSSLFMGVWAAPVLVRDWTGSEDSTRSKGSLSVACADSVLGEPHVGWTGRWKRLYVWVMRVPEEAQSEGGWWEAWDSAEQGDFSAGLWPSWALLPDCPSWTVLGSLQSAPLFLHI